MPAVQPYQQFRMRWHAMLPTPALKASSPSPTLHCSYSASLLPGLLCWGYIIFTGVFYALDGTDSVGHRYIYPQLSWGVPLKGGGSITGGVRSLISRADQVSRTTTTTGAFTHYKHHKEPSHSPLWLGRFDATRLLPFLTRALSGTTAHTILAAATTVYAVHVACHPPR